MAIFINGAETKIPLEQLIREGKEIIKSEGLFPSSRFSEEMHAASIAVTRYDEAHRRWVEENKDKEKKNK
jgi:hypothetical protein